MIATYRAPSTHTSLEGLARSLIETTAADQVFVYGAAGQPGLLDPLLALGALSLHEKQAFWTSQIEAGPLAELLAGPLAGPQPSPFPGQGSAGALPGARALIAYPLRSRGPQDSGPLKNSDLLGLVLAAWRAPGAQLNPIQQRQAELLTRAMTLELDNARLYEATHQQAQQAAVARETTQAILRRDDLPSILGFIAAECLRALDALGCAIRLLDPAGQLLPAVEAGSPFPSAVAFLAGDALRDRAAPWRAPVAAEEKLEEPTSVLVVPLLSDQKPIGFLEAHQIDAYTQTSHLPAAQSFASQAAVAVELARLSQRLQESAVAEERARLARDLHDSINQSLYAITLYSHAARRKLDEGSLPAVAEHLGELHATAREALGEMRLLIFALRPLALEHYGLKGVLEQRLQAVEKRSGLQAHLEVALNAALPPALEENLYHIALESLNNIIKHAQASSVSVEIRQMDGRVLFSVRDDGVGFDPSMPSAGMGLKSIQERAAAMGGQCVIQSQPGAGVTVSVEVPYEPDSHSCR